MSGFMFLTAACFGCGKLFTSNPNSVPSFEDQPICETCIKRVNAKRKASGLPLWPVATDAYQGSEA